eukprot:scaffold282580_cov28-Tisochrysis_lutea.AAC.3
MIHTERRCNYARHNSKQLELQSSATHLPKCSLQLGRQLLAICALNPPHPLLDTSVWIDDKFKFLRVGKGKKSERSEARRRNYGLILDGVEA